MADKYNAQGIVWDLKEYYNSLDDKELENDINKVLKLSKEFHKNYKDVLIRSKSDVWLKAFKDNEEMMNIAKKIGYYIYLRFSADLKDPEVNRAYNKVDMMKAKIYERTAFFGLCIKNIKDEKIRELLENDELKLYERYFEMIRKYVPFTLSEKEEILISEKNITGHEAWVKFYLEYNSSIKYKIDENGKTKEVNLSTINKMRRSSNRREREQAYYSRQKGIEENKDILITSLNNVFRDNMLECERRGYNSIIETAYLRDDISEKVINTMREVIKDNYYLARKWLKIKAKMMDISKIDYIDWIAPIVKNERKFSFEEAKELVIKGYSKYSKEFGKIMKHYFDSNIIDAENRNGKKSGAFCMSGANKRNSRVLMSYNGSIGAVKTIAHEFGHALHNYYIKDLPMVYSGNPLIMAETASTFGEIMVMNYLMEEYENDKNLKTTILQGFIENFNGTVFRQNMFVEIEGKLYKELDEKGRISEKEGCRLWKEINDNYVGDSIDESIPFFDLGWCTVPHFIHSKFYCFAYSFGKLLSDSLYQLVLEDPKNNINIFTSIISKGRIMSPENILRSAGIDISKKEFWEKAFIPYKQNIDRIEKLAYNDKYEEK